MFDINLIVDTLTSYFIPDLLCPASKISIFVNLYGLYITSQRKIKSVRFLLSLSIGMYVNIFQTSSPQKPLGQSKSNLIWSVHGMGERKFVLLVQVT